jgi:hypothetical protein
MRASCDGNKEKNVDSDVCNKPVTICLFQKKVTKLISKVIELSFP